MGGGYVSNAGVFLVDVVFGLYIFAVMLRFILQMVRADFYNPICQAIVKITNPPLRPMRRVIPAIGTIDTASVVLLLLLQCITTFLIALMLGVQPGPATLLLVALAELLDKVVWTFMGAIFIQVILSWVSPGTYNPATSLIYSITEPVLRPARRILPSMGGLDLSPMLALVVLQLTRILIIAPLRDAGRVLF